MRFEPDNSQDDVTVSLYSEDSRAHDVAILHLDTEIDHGREATVVVDVPRSANVVIQEGETATLLFSAADPDTSVIVCGKVIFRSENRSSIQYQFELDDTGTRNLTHLAERRRAVRVRVNPIQPVPVILQDIEGGECVEGRMRDVSTNGIAVLLDPQNDPIVSSSWKLSVSVRFPGDNRTVGVVGTVRYRKLAGAAIQYGIEFDWDETPGCAEQRNLLAQYVSSRQGGR